MVGGETVGNSLAIGNSLGRAPLQGSDVLRSRAVGTVFQDKFHEFDCPKNCAPKTFQVVCKRRAMGHA